MHNYGWLKDQRPTEADVGRRYGDGSSITCRVISMDKSGVITVSREGVLGIPDSFTWKAAQHTTSQCFWYDPPGPPTMMSVCAECEQSFEGCDYLCKECRA